MISACQVPSAIRASACGGLQLQRLFEAAPDLAAETLGECLADRDTLAVTTEGVGMDVPGVGIIRFGSLPGDAAFGDLFEQPQLFVLVVFQVVGVDHRCLVGGVDAGVAGFQPEFQRLGEIAGVVGTPGVLHALHRPGKVRSRRGAGAPSSCQGRRRHRRRPCRGRGIFSRCSLPRLVSFSVHLHIQSTIFPAMLVPCLP